MNMKAQTRIKRYLLTALMVCLLIPVLNGCVIVRHSDLEAEGPAGDQLKYSAEAYREENWDKVVKNIIDRSSDAVEVLAAVEADVDVAGEKYGRRAQQAGSAWNFGIAGKAKIVKVNTELKAGTVLLDLEPYDGEADLTMQVGPVFRTNTLRDFTDFIKFDDFSNQVEYANLTGAFNKAVSETVIDGIEWEIGTEYDFVGAFTWQNNSEPEKIQMIPVQLKEAGD